MDFVNGLDRLSGLDDGHRSITTGQRMSGKTPHGLGKPVRGNQRGRRLLLGRDSLSERVVDGDQDDCHGKESLDLHGGDL